MLPVVGAHVWLNQEEKRHNVYRLSGPGRWPLAAKEGAGVEELYVIDKAAPAGSVRRLREDEIWQAQGRSQREWKDLQLRYDPAGLCKEGCEATGRRTALCLLVAAQLCQENRKDLWKAGMCYDGETTSRWGRSWFGFAGGEEEILGVHHCRGKQEEVGRSQCGFGAKSYGLRHS